MKKLVTILSVIALSMFLYAILSPSPVSSQGAGTAASLYRTAFVNLLTQTASSVRYCTNCQATSPCTSGGSGAFAFKVGSAWNCTDGGGGSSDATKALDNLASVNINTSLLAQTGVDLGSTAKPFRNAFLFGSGTYGTTYLELTGTPTGTRVLTLPDTTDTLVGKATTDELTNKTLTTSVGKGTWTASGTWTLPAFTLGGTVSGGGNDLNNTRIGNVTPLAGTFTTLISGLHTVSVGNTTSAQTDLLINPTTKASGNLIDAQINSVPIFTVSSGGTASVGIVQANNYYSINTGGFYSSSSTESGMTVRTAGNLDFRNGNAVRMSLDTSGNLNVVGGLTAPSYNTTTNCADSAGAAACGSAAAGAFVIDATTTSTVVSTTAVTANSLIFVQEDSSLGTRLGVTCNTQSSLTLGALRVTARTASTSFTVTIEAGPTTNPMCVSYHIVN